MYSRRAREGSYLSSYHRIPPESTLAVIRRLVVGSTSRLKVPIKTARCGGVPEKRTPM